MKITTCRYACLYACTKKRLRSHFKVCKSFWRRAPRLPSHNLYNGPHFLYLPSNLLGSHDHICYTSFISDQSTQTLHADLISFIRCFLAFRRSIFHSIAKNYIVTKTSWTQTTRYYYLATCPLGVSI